MQHDDHPALVASYRDIPYVADAASQTDPAVFGVAAALRGLAVADPKTARILDIGCAVGGNLLPLAAKYPSATCVGIDLSPEQIATATATAKELGLGNVRFLARDLTTLSADDGPYDFVFAHGVYSWVPDAVRAVLLARIRDLLAPGGVAYVSYNALPGGYRRLALRGLMQLRDGVTAGRELVEFAAQLATEGPHRDALREEALRLREVPDGYLAHDHLEAFHHPVWYRDFVADARRSGLQVVGDAVLHAEALRSVPDEALALLGTWVDDVDAQQVLDVLRDRSFRQTVLVCDGATTKTPDVSTLHLWSDLRATGDGRYSDGTRTVAPRDPGLARLMSALDAAWPGTVAVADLGDVGDAVLKTLSMGAVEATLAPIPAARAGRSPKVWDVARAQARTSNRLVNLRHQTVVVPDAVRQLAARLNGHRAVKDKDRAAVGFLEANALLSA